jgi:hypothetical protein
MRIYQSLVSPIYFYHFYFIILFAKQRIARPVSLPQSEEKFRRGSVMAGYRGNK